MESLEEIRLPGAVRSRDEYDSRFERQLERGIRAEVS